MVSNDAALNTWEFMDYPNGADWAPSYWDTTVLHSGNPSIRQEGKIVSGSYKTREVNSPWIPISAGDHLVFSVYIKTDTATETPEHSFMGARVGIDFYGSSSNLGGVAYDPEGDEPVWPNPTPGVTANWVAMATDWTYREIDLIVPATINGLVPYGVKLWFQVWVGYSGGSIIQEMGDSWFSDTIFYINPPPDPLPTYTLTISAAANGTTDPVPDDYEQDLNTTLNVDAVPDGSYGLDHWVLDSEDAGSENAILITFDDDHVLAPVFATPPENTWTLTISAGDNGSVSPTGEVEGNDGDSTPSVTATADDGYDFDHWLFDGGEETDNPFSVVINDSDAHTLAAVFAASPTVTITLTLAPATGGSTVPVAGDIVLYEGYGQEVYATADSRYKFMHWLLDGIDAGSSNPFYRTYSEDCTLEAVFAVSLGKLEEVIHELEKVNVGEYLFEPNVCVPGIDNFKSKVRDLIARMEK